MPNIPAQALEAIQLQFHQLIRERSAHLGGDLMDQHALMLPDLAQLHSSDEPKDWFPVPGMYGGSAIRLRARGKTQC